MKKSRVLTNWIGLPDNFQPEEYEGFVYLVVNTLTQKKYIGKKFLWSKRRVKQKGKSRRKRVTKESDWQYYKSSSETLQKDIQTYGQEAFEFRILSLHRTRAETNYTEVREQFMRDVINSSDYYNDCIMNRWYRSKKK